MSNDRLPIVGHLITVDDHLAEALKELAEATKAAELCLPALDQARQAIIGDAAEHIAGEGQIKIWLIGQKIRALDGIRDCLTELTIYRKALKPLVDAALAEIEREASNEQ